MRPGLRHWFSALRFTRPALRWAAAAVTGRARGSLFEPSGALEIRAPLAAPVRIVRDRFAVPYVEAATWSDAAAAIGFLHGCDRLAQLELFRRLAWGRLAEVLGRIALPVDVAMRTLGYKRLAVAYATRIDPETLDLLHSYAAGVNAAVDRRQAAGALPLEYRILKFDPEPWGVLDSLAVSRVATTDVNLPSKAFLSQLLTEAPAELTPLLLPNVQPEAEAPLRDPGQGAAGAESPTWGSNAFAVGAARCRYGRPIVCTDPHVGLQAPCPWYATSVRIARTDEALAGLTVPGWPFLVLGRNRRVAWGAANMLAESADLFREKLTPDGYELDGETRPLTVQDETIRVGRRRQYSVAIRSTHRGPLVSDAPLLRRMLGLPDGAAVSLASPAHHAPTDELTAFYRINRAGDLSQFEQALSHYGQCSMNFIAADVDGHIGQFPVTALPVRGRPPSGGILDGSTSRYDWNGVRFPGGLPNCIDPPEGFLANSNDLPVPGGDPAVIGHLTCPPYRGDRLRSLLRGEQKLSPLKAAEIQADRFCSFTHELVRRVVPLLQPGEESIERDAAAMLRRFDGRMEGRSAAAAVAGVFSEFFRRRLFASLLGGPRHGLPARGRFGQGPARGLGERFATNYQSCPATMRMLDAAETDAPAVSKATLGTITADAFGEAIRYLRRTQGRSPRLWKWGRVVRVRMSAPLGMIPLLGRRFRIPALPGAGSAHTVSQCRFRFSPDRRSQNVHLGVTARLIMPLHRDEIAAALSTGQSESPWSEHFRDQCRLLHKGGFVRISLNGLPDQGVKSTLILKPSE